MPDLALDGERIARTIDLLCQRVEHRFPASDLLRIANELSRIAAKTKQRAEWIGRPILGLRIAVGALILLIVAGLAVTLVSLRTPREAPEALQFIQTLEAGINDIVLVGAGIFFLLTIETRIKRRRALQAIHELRALAHIIDMHQLTKDPEWLLGRGQETGLLPPRTMTRFELSRYLDYCSEMLSLAAKVAALYIQAFEDDVALAAVNEVENLTSGLSRKIWQKLMIVYAAEGKK
jgi:hypothetical protein